MRTLRRFHLVAVTPDLTRTLVIRTAAGWLLPWLDDDPRAKLPEQIEALLAGLGLASNASELIHEAPLIPATPSGSIVHGYCCTLVSGSTLGPNIVAIANDDLQMMPALILLQCQVWRLALSRLRNPVADFDSGSRVAGAREWIERQVADRADARVLSMKRHRCTRYEYVVRLETTKGPMYFKGGLERVADEGVLTGLLSRLASDSLPETLAIDVAQGYWVYRELPGDLLLGPHLTVNAAIAAATALAVLQQRAADDSSVADHLAARRLTALDLIEAVDRIVHDVVARNALQIDRNTGHPNQLDERFEAWLANRPTLFERCHVVDRVGLPSTLVLSDFRPHNILATNHGIGFIDVERSYWGLPLLSLWRFSQEVERRLQTGGIAQHRMQSAVVEAWAHSIDPSTLAHAFDDFLLLGSLFELLLASRELELHERDADWPLPIHRRAKVVSQHLGRLLALGVTTTQMRLD